MAQKAYAAIWGDNTEIEAVQMQPMGPCQKEVMVLTMEEYEELKKYKDEADRAWMRS